MFWENRIIVQGRSSYDPVALHEGSDSDTLQSEPDKGLVGHCKIPAEQPAKLPRYGREGRLSSTVPCRDEATGF